MKKPKILLSSLGLAIAATAMADPLPVALTVNGAQPSGKIFGQVFSDEATFKTRQGGVLRFAIDAGGEPSASTTLNLAPGRYAIVVFQDTQHTGKLETNMFGVPKVPYGFSNGARSGFGPPGFDAAAFTVDAAHLSVAIDLR